MSAAHTPIPATVEERMARPLYKIVSLLLQYPDEALLGLAPQVAAALEALPASGQKTALARFLAYWQGAQPVTLQQEYVRTFDFQKRVSLYLTFYQYGDRRQRGMAMLRLKRRLATAGLPLRGSELPDYLPVLLEFAAFAPEGYGEELLAEFRAALELVRVGLHDARSPYSHLLDAICLGLPALTLAEQQDIRRLAAAGPPGEQVGLEPFAPPEIMPPASCGGGR